MMVNNNLVGGAITILKNMSSSMRRIIPYIMENKKWLKPPSSYVMFTGKTHWNGI